MSRTFNIIIAAALALATLIGGCASETEEAVENVAVENAVDDIGFENEVVVDENVMLDSNMAMDANAADSGNDVGAVDNGANLIAPPATSTEPAESSEKGLGAFVEPGDMAVDSYHPLEFVAAKEEPTLAEDSLVEESGGRPLAMPGSIRIAPIMKVTLITNSNFKAKETSDAEQEIGPDKAASWHWEVMPLKRGAHILKAKVEVLKELPDGTRKVIDSDTSTVDVTVKVGTWKGFLNALREASNLGELLKTLFGAWEKALLALAALIVAFWGVVWAIKNRGKSGG